MPPQAYIFALVAVLLVVELAQGRHRGVHRRQDGLIIAATFLGGMALRPLLALVTAGAMALALPSGKGALAGVPFLAAFAVILLIAEFWQYWLHRTAHDSVRHPILHGMHRTHHSAPYVNVTLLYRANLLWAWIHPYTWITAAAVYLGQAAAAATFYLAIMLWNVITHSDWRWDDAIIAKVQGGARIVAAFEWVFVTPRIHHTHHGYGRDGRAFRNFCTLLTIYDRAFGTLHVPQGRPWRYGLPGGEHHWARQMIYPLVPLGPALKRDRRGRVAEAGAADPAREAAAT